MATPRYRITDGEPIGLAGMVRFPGEEIEHRGWLGQWLLRLEPLNPIATAIAGYEKRHRGNAFLPPTPFNEKVGRIFLPGELPNFMPGRYDHPTAGRHVAFIPDDQADPAMPRYEATLGGIPIRNRVLMAGEKFYWVGWPMNGFRPLNGAAVAISQYWEKHKGHPDLLSAPWCCFSGLTLPELQAFEQPKPSVPITRPSFPTDPDSKALERAIVERMRAGAQ
jgi:hypothetical protein